MSTIDNIESFLTFASKKSNVISHNISNLQTPGYKQKQVTFNELAKKHISPTSTHPMHRSSSDNQEKYSVVEERSGEVQSSGNNVDLGTQLVELMKNNQKRSLGIEMLNHQYRTKDAARGQ